MSRNKIPPFLAQMFNFSEQELAEYEAATNEEQLANIIIRDAGLKGCKLVSNEEVQIKSS